MVAAIFSVHGSYFNDFYIRVHSSPLSLWPIKMSKTFVLINSMANKGHDHKP